MKILNFQQLDAVVARYVELTDQMHINMRLGPENRLRPHEQHELGVLCNRLDESEPCFFERAIRLISEHNRIWRR